MKGETQPGTTTVTDGMIDSMRSTKPWTRFMAWIGFATVILMVLVGSVVTFFSSMFPKETGVRPLVAGPFFLLLSLLSFVPALYLYRFSTAVGNFLESGASLDMERALLHQKAFWRIVGITVLTVLLLALLATAAFLMIR